MTLGATNSLTIAENNNYTGTTTINSGTVQIGNGGTIGSLGAGTIVNNGTLLYTRSDDPTVANVISGTGSLVINGGGATLTGRQHLYRRHQYHRRNRFPRQQLGWAALLQP